MKKTSIRRNVTRTAAAVVLGGTAMATFAAPSANAASADTWNQLAYCESGGNWATNTVNGFSGGLQFTDQTWAAYGGGQYAANAWQASSDQQIAVAERVLADAGWGAWPACSAKLGLYGSGETGNANATATTAPQQEVSVQSEEVAEAPAVEAPATQETAVAAPAAEETTVAAPAAGTQYTVVAGDTLSEIALAYGITDWSIVAAANADIVPNPDIIEIGQVLTIPAV